MKLVSKIAANELRNLFYSPVAWFLTIAFLVQCAIFYTYDIVPSATLQDVLMRFNAKWREWEGKSFTHDIFLGPNGVFFSALQNLYLFVPLLTMGLISREINNGTIKLLYSSPVRTSQVVLGKYLAMMIYCLLMVGIIGVFMVMGAFNIRNVDYGLLLSAALGFYLLVCAYAAIGLFMSTLSTYQVISAIATFTLIFGLSRISQLWQQYDFFREITYFLSIAGRSEKMLSGLITTRDVLYFVIIVGMFVLFAMIRLMGTREFLPWYRTAARYVLVVFVSLGVGFISSRPGLIGYWDTTAGKVNTINRKTQEIIKSLGEEPIEVTLYTNLLGGGAPRAFPNFRNDYVWNFWEAYVRFKPNIKLKYVYYYDVDDNDRSMYRRFPGKSLDEIAKLVCKGASQQFSLFKKPAEIRRMIDVRNEGYRVVMQLKYKDRTAFVRTFEDGKFWPDEEHVAAAFKQLVDDGPQKIAFLTGDLERNIWKNGEREFNFHSVSKDSRSSLVNHGFVCDTVNLEQRDIPAGIAALVLADPKTELGLTTRLKLQRYIDAGGNLIIFGEPGKQQVLNPVLAYLGVRFMPGTLVQPSTEEMPHMLYPYLPESATNLAENDYMIRARGDFQRNTGDTLKLLMPGASAIQVDSAKFAVNPVLLTVPGRVWLKAGHVVVDSVPPVFDPAQGDSKADSFVTALALTRKVKEKENEQRVLICGDADFMSSFRGGGSFLSPVIYNWVDYGRYPVFLIRKDPVDNLLLISKRGSIVQLVIFVWLVPALLLAAGTIILLRRKRK